MNNVLLEIMYDGEDMSDYVYNNLTYLTAGRAMYHCMAQSNSGEKYSCSILVFRIYSLEPPVEIEVCDLEDYV